jgi:type II secretory pathway pseudopilin PulG
MLFLLHYFADISILYSVMKEIIGKLLEYRKRNTTILIALLVIVLITLLFLNGVIKLPSWGKKIDSNQANQEALNQLENALKNQELANKVAPVTKIPVQIATLSSDDYDGVITGDKAGCDIVRMVYRYVEPTPAILNATMKELFSYNAGFDYLPGNFLASQEKLKFEKAVLEEGTAKIYLTGEVKYSGVCDNPRLESQIIATAKQFDTVYAVKIYLNDKEYKAPTGK